MFKKYSVKKTILKISVLVILWLLIMALFAATTLNLNRYEQRCERATETYTAYSEAGALLKTDSATLTEEARQYVLSGELSHLNAYFKGTDTTPPREQALTAANSVEPLGNTGTLLQDVIEVSDRLMQTELHAMKLRAVSDGIAPEELPSSLADYALPPEEAEASSETQLHKAFTLLIDDDYTNCKDSISDSVDAFILSSLNNLQTEYNLCSDVASHCVTQQRLLLVLFGIDLLCIIMVLLNAFREAKRVAEKLRETAIIAGLTDDFAAVFYAEPKRDTILTVKNCSPEQLPLSGLPKKMTFAEFTAKVGAFVCPEDAADFAARISRDNLLREFAMRRSVYWNFRITDGDLFKYFRMKLIHLEQQENNIFGVLIGLTDVDEHTRERMRYEQELEQQVKNQADIIRSAMGQEDIVHGMATLVESRDMNTGTHIQNTQYYVTLLVRRLQQKKTFPELEDESLAHDIIFASVLHDIGKIFISDFLLNKPGKLTQDEFEVIKTHTTLGGDIVNDIFRNCIEDKTVQVIRDIVRHHHEKWNGTGYPDGLAGDAIPLSARITAVADVFDALTSRRSYKESMEISTAFRMIHRDSGTHFDKRIADAFLELKDDIQTYLDIQKEESTQQRPFSHAYVSFEKKLQQESIINGLASDFQIVCYARPDEDRIAILRHGSSTLFSPNGDEAQEISMSFATFLSAMRTLVHPSEDGKLSQTMSQTNIRQQLQGGTVRFLTFRSAKEEGDTCCEIKLIRLGKAEDANFDVLIGIHDVARSELRPS